LYDELEDMGLKGEIILDNRNEQPGFRMNDARFVLFEILYLYNIEYFDV
jgi:hypothetical protein